VPLGVALLGALVGGLAVLSASATPAAPAPAGSEVDSKPFGADEAVSERGEPLESEEMSEVDRALASIEWTTEGSAQVGDLATLALEPGLRFTGRQGTRTLLELMQNPADGSDLGLLTTDSLDWFVIFDFDDVGYVENADQEALDSDDLLDSLKEGNVYANEARAERGWPPISIVGWHTEPFYNAESKNLEWCIEGVVDGRRLVNYNTRILGRRGVMSANLLVSPEELDEVLPEIRRILTGFAFSEGQSYAEFRAGDKIAQYGLGALVVGGAVGVAAKMGLLAKLGTFLAKAWKFVIFGLLAFGAGLKRLFQRGTPAASERDDSEQSQPSAEAFAASEASVDGSSGEASLPATSGSRDSERSSAADIAP